MTVNKFIRNLLNLKELAVSHFELEIRRRTLNLWVKHRFSRGFNRQIHIRFCDRSIS